MSKEDKKVPVEGQENFLLKKIRYYQGSIEDFDTYWKQKSAEGEKEESPETKACKVKNAELNKAFEIIPVEDDSKETGTQPGELSPEEKKEIEGEKKDDEKKVEKDDEKKDEKKDDDKKKKKDDKED